MNALRTIPAALLSGVSAVFSGAAKLTELGARRLNPPATPPESVVIDTAPSPRGPLAEADRAETPGEVLEVTADEVRADLGTAGEAARAAGQAAGETARAAGQAAAETAGTARETAATAAAGAAETARETAETAREAGARRGGRADQAPAPAAPAAPAAPVAPVGEGQARTYESHIAELADRPVARVVKEIQDLSTEELGQLFEYESAHRKRKTVLQAIERASAPESNTRS